MHYDAIFIGTGFASTFFLRSYLERASRTARVLVLERGRFDTHAWQLRTGRTSSVDATATFVNESPAKEWVFSVGFGGGSNCWTAGVGRLMPNDFRMRSQYGVGTDWPLSYADLEPFYQAAEEIMAVSGPDDNRQLFPRSRPYPQPPHDFSRPDLLLKQRNPDAFFQQPTARARLATSRRPACCANGVCRLCPIGAKFTIENELGYLYQDPRVTLRTEATAQAVQTAAGIVSGVTFEHAGMTQEAAADLVVLGANAIFNAHILLRSGFRHALLGRRLHEQAAVDVQVKLNGLDNVGGSTLITGQGYAFYDGVHRTERAAAMVETLNPVVVRLERGRWRQLMNLTVSFESLGDDDNLVAFDPSRPDLPIVRHDAPSPYTQRAIDRVPAMMDEFLAGLPVESIAVDAPTSNEAHIIGTTVMGNDPASSVLDKHSVYHGVPNLVVLGSGAFPTSAPMQPSLTISAMALWSAAGVLR
ncbi:MAG: GMC family oxidoreductase [Gemmatimonadaceae bacterium]|nr:GMC family oxidoreductase [Gemmatimonadaceae bacterium]